MKITASHILVTTLSEAQSLIDQINDGASFDSVASQYSNCPSSRNGGNLGSFGKGMMVKPFEDAAYALEVGQISEPVATQFGFHIILRTE